MISKRKPKPLTSEELQRKAAHVFQLAEYGSVEMANGGLQALCQDIQNSSKTVDLQTMRAYQHAYHRTGIEIALSCADYSYQEQDRSSARNWLRYAKMHARELGMDISQRVKELRRMHTDYLPLFLKI